MLQTILLYEDCRIRPRRKGFGQALPEYALIGGLILAISIGALVLLGKNLQNTFSNMLAARPSRSLVASAPGQGRQGATAGQGGQVSRTGQEQQGISGEKSSEKLCLENGQCVDVGSQGNEMSTPVQTTGGNGSQRTAYYAAQLKQMALTYADIPDPNLRVQDQLNILVQRAYEFAELQRAYENDLAKNNYVLSVEIAKKYHEALWQAWSEVKKPIAELQCGYTDPNCWINIYTPQKTSRLTPEIMAVIDQATQQFDGSHLKYTEETKQVQWKADGAEGMALDSGEFQDPESVKTKKEGDNVCDAAKEDCQP